MIATIRSLVARILKFGVVGVIGVCCDVLTSNLLWHLTDLNTTAAGVLGTVISTAVGYVGNRWWTFRDRPKGGGRRELGRFLLISAIGLVIENSFLFVSSHVLGYNSPLADNFAKFGLGLVAGGVFRFWTMHVFVFPKARENSAGPSGRTPDHTGAAADEAVRNGV